MSGIINRISHINGLFALKGVTANEVNAAELALNIQFAPDFSQYLKSFGCMSFGAHEFTGLGTSKRLDVVEVTRFERKNKGFLQDKYVIEVRLDGEILVAQNYAGTVYELTPDGSILKEYPGFLDYIDSII